MKKKSFTPIILLAVILLAGCAPSEATIKTAVAQTLVVKAIVETLNAVRTISSTPSPPPSPTRLITLTPSMNDTQDSKNISAKVNINHMNLFTAPSTNQKTILCGQVNCSYSKGTQATLLGKHELYGEIWFLVSMPDGKTGWVYQGWLQIIGDVNYVPTASADRTITPPAPEASRN